MAQKRRGLGRGLQALIPDAQKETVASGRPSDVFFPDNREGDVADVEVSALEHIDSLEDTEAAGAREKVVDAEVGGSVGTDYAAYPNDSVKRVSRADSLRDADSDTSSSSAPGSQGREAADRQVKSRTESVRQGRRSDRIREQTKEPSHSSSSNRLDEDSLKSGSSWGEDTSGFKDVSRETSSSAFRDDESSRTVSRGLSEQQGVHVGSDKESVHVGVHASQEEELVPVPGASFAEIPLELISPNPRQPRQVFDEEEIAELAASIVEVGLLQPIVVRRVAVQQGQKQDHFELILGERRLRAAKKASLDTVPAVVRDTDDVDMLRNALLENLHRVQLNPLEEAAAYQQLLEDFDCTQAELSERIARSRSQISNTLRLMKLPPLVQRRLAAGVLSAGHARALLGLSHVDVMERMAQKIVAEGLSVRATEEMVALHEESDSSRQQSKKLRTRTTPLPELSTRLSDVFDTRVKVTKGARKGRITIEFAGDDDLARIVRTLSPGTSLDEE